MFSRLKDKQILKLSEVVVFLRLSPMKEWVYIEELAGPLLVMLQVLSL
jgi:hypothetical protein